MCRIISFLMMILVFFTITGISQEIWTEFEKNPVLTPSNGLQAENPCVLFDNNKFSARGPEAFYKMWFTTEKGITFALSENGKEWTEYNNSQPLAGLQTTGNLAYVLYDPNGFGGTTNYYRIWYWNGIKDSIEGIRTAESADGINWINDQPLRQHPTNISLQLVTDPGIADNYFAYIYGTGSILYNPENQNIGSLTPEDKTDDQPMSYNYVMYYNSSSEGLSPERSIVQTSLAYSVDGIYWIRYGDKPVMTPSGNTNDWDGLNRFNARVLKVGKEYLLWYSGSDNLSISTPPTGRIGSGSSTDGMNWNFDQKSKLTLKSNSESDNSMTFGHSVIPISKGDGSKYGVWTAVANETNKYSINYYEINLGKKIVPLSYWNGKTVGYAPFDAHFEYQSGSADRTCNMGVQLWHWDFGDGNSVEGDWLSRVDHTYYNPGTFTVSVKVGCYGRWEDDDQHIIYVRSQSNSHPCGEHKGIYVDKCTGNAPFAFEAWINQEDWDHELTCYLEEMYWRWDFGDGTTQEGYDAWVVTHTYEKAGIYTITATNLCNGIYEFYSDTQKIIVNGYTSPCFTVQQESAFAPSTIHFDTSCTQIPSSFTIVSYLWDFGDGQQASGTSQSMNHEYSNPGRYTVTMQIIDSTGQKYSFSQIITIKGLFAPSSITLERQVDRSLFAAKARNVLKWVPNSQIFECTVVKYNIYRKLVSQPDSEYRIVGSVDGNIFEFTDDGITLNERYSYVLTAVESEGHESAFSAPVE